VRESPLPGAESSHGGQEILGGIGGNWLKQLKVDGKTQGRFVMDANGDFTQVP